MADNFLCNILGCDKPVRAGGMCVMHYQRRRMGKDLDCPPHRVASGATRRWIEEHIKWAGDDCLIWPFARLPNGYGRANIRGVGALAHRHMCALVNGAPAHQKMQAAHTCGMGHLGCVNPKHLRWATARENHADKYSHGTANNGANNGTAKLSWQQADEIRKAEGVVMATELAKHYGIAGSTVYRIWRGQSYAKGPQ